MRIRVQLFARARDLAGADSVDVDLPGTATVRELRGALAQKIPALEPLLKRSAIALDEEFAEDSMPLNAESKIALLPPVSGGSGADWGA